MRAATTWIPIVAIALAGCSSRSEGAAGDESGADGSVDAGATGDGSAAGPDAACPVRCGLSGACCGEGEVCETDRCLPACDGTRCGADDGLCCTGDELCVGDLCVLPGAPCTDWRDCAETETCEPLVGRCVPVPEGAACRYVPPRGVFEPEVQWAWEGGHVIALPLVVQVTGSADVPEVVVLATEGEAAFEDARLVVLSGTDGSVVWRSPDDLSLCGSASPAAGDLDGDGDVEIVTLASGGEPGCGPGPQDLVAFASDGAVAWRSSVPVRNGYPSIAIADLEGDGAAEVVVDGRVFEADGTLRFESPELGWPPGISIPAAADLDGDGEDELVITRAAVRADGSVLWSHPSDYRVGYVAVARVIEDPAHPGPQVIVVDGTTIEVLDGATGTAVWGPVTYEPATGLAGPPTVADFDADGRPEIGIAGEHRYVVIDPDLPAAPHVLWSVDSEDVTTGSVGSTVFDFDADGAAEVIYADECHLRILSGADGTRLWSTTNTSATVMEYPVIADVDADGNAEMVVVANHQPELEEACPGRSLPYEGGVRGVRVFRDRLDNWVPTRRVWNQHTYHIDNVREDGSIPAVEAESWATHNTYRLNRLLDPESITSAPDLVVTALDARVDACPVRAVLRARIANVGSRGVPAGVPVAFREGEPGSGGALLGVALTERGLLAGAGAWVELDAADVPLDDDRMLRFHAVADDDGTGHGTHSECREDNNASHSALVECRGPI